MRRHLRGTRRFPSSMRAHTWRVLFSSSVTGALGWRDFEPRLTEILSEVSLSTVRAIRHPRPDHRLRSASYDHDLGVQVGSGVRSGPGTRSARALGVGGSGPAYKTRLLELGDQDKPDYRALQPFGQVPIFEGTTSPCLNQARSYCTSANEAKYSCRKMDPARTRDAMADRSAQFDRALRHERCTDRLVLRERGMGETPTPGRGRVRARRLSASSQSLGDKQYLMGTAYGRRSDDDDGAAILKHTDIVTSDKRLADYVERCTERSAFKRASTPRCGISRPLLKSRCLATRCLALATRGCAGHAMFAPDKEIFTVAVAAMSGRL